MINLSDAIVAFEKLHAEEKGTKPRYLASMALKTLKKAQENIILASKEKTASADGSGKGSGGRGADVSHRLDKQAVNTVCFCITELLCENSQSKSVSKLVITTLDAASALFTSGFIPVNLWMRPPVIEVPSHTPGIAQEFFMRLLGGGGGSSSNSTAVGGTPSPSGDGTPAKGEKGDANAIRKEGDESASQNPSSRSDSLPANGADHGSRKRLEDAFDAAIGESGNLHRGDGLVWIYATVVDAALRVSAYAQSKESNERLWASFLNCLQNAVCPRWLTKVASLESLDLNIRAQALAIHGERLERIVSLLLLTLTRQAATLALVEEARSILHSISRAMTRAVEQEDIVPGTQVNATVNGVEISSTTYQKDLIWLLDKCSTVALTGIADCAGLPSATPAAPTSTVGPSSGGQQNITTAVTPFFSVHTVLSTILQVSVNGGPAFRRSQSISKIIKYNVFPIVLRTSLVNDWDTFRLSLNVLLTVSIGFSSDLVNETSTFFNNVLFRLLQAKHSTTAQKCLVVEGFRRYIEEPQNLLSLFLNYDCNTTSQSIYEMMIAHLAALANPRNSASPSSPREMDTASPSGLPITSTAPVSIPYVVAPELQRAALMTLLLVADSNVQWIERFECDQPSMYGGDVTASFYPNGKSSIGGDEGSAGTLENQGEGPPLAGAGVTGGVSEDHFTAAKRIKDQRRYFFALFNDQKQPVKALEYLVNQSQLLTYVEPRDLPTGTQESGKDDETAPPIAVSNDDTSTSQAAAPGEAGTAEPTGEDVPTSTAQNTAEGGAAPSGTGAAAKEELGSHADSLESEADKVASACARFLLSNEDYIDKLVLGEYFSKCLRKQETRLVFEQWIALHDFTGLMLDEALRQFLGGFKIVGEAQVVDKTMELFAARFCKQNPHVFTSADTAFILSFSICMLNTDAHSAHVKEKMTLEGFLRNNAGIDEGKDIDRDILAGIYTRIATNEIKLRPSAGLKKPDEAQHEDETSAAHRAVSGLLESIPIFRHLAPFATAITDTVMIPVDAAGNALFNIDKRRREELHRAEFRAILRDALDALHSATPSTSHYVQATTIENAIPMWGVTVSAMVSALEHATELCCAAADRTELIMAASGGPGGSGQSGSASGNAANTQSNAALSLAAAAGGGASGLNSDAAGGSGAGGAMGAQLLADTPEHKELLDALVTGATKTIRVCCAFGTLGQAEDIADMLFRNSQVQQAVVVKVNPPSIEVTKSVNSTRLTFLATLLNTYLTMGSMFTSRMWYTAYSAISFLDALANGLDGIWERQKLIARSASTVQGSGARLDAGGTAGSGRGGSKAEPAAQSSKVPPKSQPISSTAHARNASAPVSALQDTAGSLFTRDLWFGNLSDPISRMDAISNQRRAAMLQKLRDMANVDLWLERLFDATAYPTSAQLQMAAGLTLVCQRELDTQRTFAFTKLLDFVTVCATFSSRMQWRSLWTNASEIISRAGTMNTPIARLALAGLRIVALSYLTREELLNYSFQKEVLKPFESILMKNTSSEIRLSIIDMVGEIVDFRAGNLASGWNVVLSCLSHSALMPPIVSPAWDVGLRIVGKYIHHTKDCFSELVFCLTSFACNPVNEDISLLSTAYLLTCGHWLQFGLDAPPAEDITKPQAIVKWAQRFGDAERERHAYAVFAGSHIRVSLSHKPLSREQPLEKPNDFGVREEYHVWAALLEGMIPIIVVHRSVRVRCYVICVLWELIRFYGPVFSSASQESIFSSVLRPALRTLSTDSSVVSGSDAEMDSVDYRILMLLFLNGMFSACAGVDNLLSLACHTLEHVSQNTLNVSLIQSGFIDVMLRCCMTLLPNPMDSVVTSRLSSPPESASTGLVDGSQVESDAWIQSSSSAQWVSGFLHEVAQVGAINIIKLRRTASWVELHSFPFAQEDFVVSFTPFYSKIPATRNPPLIVREALLASITDGLLTQLEQVFQGCTSINDVWTVLQGIRKVLSVLTMCSINDGAIVIHHLLQFLRTCRVNKPPETNSLMPYLALLLELSLRFSNTVVCDNSSSKTVGSVKEHLHQFVCSLHESRAFCIGCQAAHVDEERQRSTSGGANTHATQNLVDRASTQNQRRVKGRSFQDVFRVCRGGMFQRSKLGTTSSEMILTVTDRCTNEWSYLSSLLFLKVVFSCGGQLASLFSTNDLREIILACPSELEEASGMVFTSSLWSESQIHLSMTPEPLVSLVLSQLMRSVTDDSGRNCTPAVPAMKSGMRN